MRSFTKGLAAALLAAVVAQGAFTLLGNTVLKGTPLMAAIEQVTGSAATTAANAALDVSGLKGQADAALRANASSIAAATGMSEAEVGYAIDALDLPSWQVTELPDDARPTGTANVSYQGQGAVLTTYADPSYVTLETAGTSVTLAVPASARDYVSLLGYL